MTSRTYARLKTLKGMWRVDGIAPIKSNDRKQIRTRVLFSELKPSEIPNAYWSSARTGSTDSLSIHVASIPDFPIGSIWEAGKRKFRSIANSHAIRVRVSRDELQSIPLSYGFKLSQRWCKSPLPEMNYAMDQNRSHLAATMFFVLPTLPEQDAKWLVIPALEIFRFYFGASSRLFSAALQGQLHKFLDWEKSSTANGTVVLRIKKPLRKKELFALARAVISDIAKEALHKPHKELASTTLKNKGQPGNPLPLIINAAFPFDGETQLTITGKKFKYENNDWAYFAFIIENCTYDPGIREIVIEPSDDWNGDYSWGSGDAASGGLIDVRPDKSDELFDDLDFVDGPADARLTRSTVLTPTNQFPGLGNVKFTYRPKNKTTQKPWSALNTGQADAIEGLSLADGDYSSAGKNIQGVTDHQERNQNISRDLTVFLDMIAVLRHAIKDSGGTINTRAPTGGLTSNGEKIASFPRHIGPRRTWHLISSDESANPRQVIWAEIQIGEFYLNLLEMELRPEESNGQCTLLVIRTDEAVMNDPDFESLLYLTAIKNRWPFADQQWKSAKDKAKAAEFFHAHSTIRLRHPSAKIKDEATEKPNKDIKGTIDPNTWSRDLIEEISDALPAVGLFLSNASTP